MYPSVSDQRSALDQMLDQVVAEVVTQVRRVGATPIDPTRARELVEAEWARHEGARVRTFLPVLVRRAVLAQVLKGD
jgi:hypothetical protein